MSTLRTPAIDRRDAGDEPVAGWNVDIAFNLARFAAEEPRYLGRGPDERNSSFDYCFNYFQSFKETERIPQLADPQHLQTSCLQPGFFLASWGMFRDSTFIHRKSARFLVPVIREIARTAASDWAIDAHEYTAANIDAVLRLSGRIREALTPHDGSGDKPTDILVTKVMLGAFGSVPAFDNIFMEGSGLRTFGSVALARLGEFYHAKRECIERQREQLRTIDFETEGKTSRLYTRAKVLDMVFWVEGNPRLRKKL